MLALSIATHCVRRHLTVIEAVSFGGRLWAAIASDHEETLRGMAMTPPVEYGCS